MNTTENSNGQGWEWDGQGDPPTASSKIANAPKSAMAIMRDSMLSFFLRNPPQRPGDLEEAFTGLSTPSLSAWGKSLWPRVLTDLLLSGEVEFGADADGVLWYAAKGNLPGRVITNK